MPKAAALSVFSIAFYIGFAHWYIAALQFFLVAIFVPLASLVSSLRLLQGSAGVGQRWFKPPECRAATVRDDQLARHNVVATIWTCFSVLNHRTE